MQVMEVQQTCDMRHSGFMHEGMVVLQSKTKCAKQRLLLPHDGNKLHFPDGWMEDINWRDVKADGGNRWAMHLVVDLAPFSWKTVDNDP